MPKIISIMAVWDEQNMIGLSIASTKDIIYQYIIVIKKGIDKTREVIDYCKKIWNLNIIIVESEIRLRYARKMAVDISKDYADYYIIQDGDEIYYNNSDLPNDSKNILNLIENGYIFAYTRMIYLHTRLDLTLKNLTKIIPHPFFFKNMDAIFWPDIVGDMPSCDMSACDIYCGKILSYECAEKLPPFKFDANIKNYRRMWLRLVFTQWHDSKYQGTIEEYADKYHHDMIAYRKNDPLISMNDVIHKCEIQSNERIESMKWHNYYNEEAYEVYPYVIKYFIKNGRLTGINTLDDLKLLDNL